MLATTLISHSLHIICLLILLASEESSLTNFNSLKTDIAFYCTADNVQIPIHLYQLKMKLLHQPAFYSKIFG